MLSEMITKNQTLKFFDMLEIGKYTTLNYLYHFGKQTNRWEYDFPPNIQ